ncbi:pullulanase-type alpha-1,6-glucosidase [Flindersiella endophytica]
MQHAKLRLVLAFGLVAAGTTAVPAAVSAREPAPPVVSTTAEAGDAELAQDSLRVDLTKERFYFVMADRFANGDSANDRGGLSGDRLQTGLDPTDKGFYHGGDLAGINAELDYIKGLGTTAIWLTPSFQNRPVQGTGANASAGYHGYWVTDFTRIDPHLGTNEELKALVDAAHGRGMKVFFDIITNHTADVIDYQEKQYTYRGKAAYPYLDTSGTPFDDKAYASGDTFPPVDATTFPYTPAADPAYPKAPAWLNDVTMYHNRGDSTFAGESSEYGDFAGLDDLWTERPEVVDGMVDIYQTWVRDAGVDGFRIDTVKHVNLEFWQRFAPALKGYAAKLGNDDFFMFGEIFDSDPAYVSTYPTKGKLQAALDFPFQSAARAYASQSAPATRLRDLFASGDYFTDADSNVYSSPTFLGNHDMGRIGTFIAQDNPGASDAEQLARDRLAHALMYFSRGQPVVYYGDEQGFTGAGGDKDARQDMFATQTQDYLDDDLIGTDATHAQDNYVATHPLYRTIKDLSDVVTEHPALRDGAQIDRYASDSAGVYAFSRIDARDQVEYVVAVNNAESAQTVRVPTYSAGLRFDPIWATGDAAGSVTSAGDRTIEVTVPALGAVVFQASAKLTPLADGPAITLTAPTAGSQVKGRTEIAADVPTGGFAQVTFAVKQGDGAWQRLGTDDNPPYRIFHDTTSIPAGTALTYKAIAKDSAGRLASTTVDVTKGQEPSDGGGGGEVPRDWLLVHYQRPAGDYDGWGLHAWGDIEGEVQWASPIPFSGEDSYGRFAWVKLAPGASNVGFIAHKGDEKDCAQDRFVNPGRNGEIWLKSGSCDVFPSQAAAQGYTTIRYHRPDGDYAGWGLHLWGDAIAPGTATSWDAPRAPDGTDSFGPFWKVPVVDPDAQLGFIVHRGDTKDPGPDQFLTPAKTPNAWIASGDTRVNASRPAAENAAVLHYHRDDGDYDGWGLHVWTGAAQTTTWEQPLQPIGRDGFGLVFRVPLAEGASSLSYIVHKGDQKDLPADQSLDLSTFGNEVWLLNGRERYLLPQVGGATLDADLTKAKAQWIDRDTVVWDVEPAQSTGYALVSSADGSLEVENGDLTTGSWIRLRWKPDGLTAAQRQRWPHLAGRAVFTVDPRDARRVKTALRGQVVATERDPAGRLLSATGVQLPGVLDDLYAPATSARLGVTWSRGVPALAVWAPTAQDVELQLYDGPSSGEPRLVQLARNESTGVWSVRGSRAWKGLYYRYQVKVWQPSVQQVVTNAVTDPYSVSLSANSTRSQLVDLADYRFSPRKPKAVPFEQASIYELHVRDFSASDSTVPAAHRGGYLAFTDTGSAGMKHLRGLAGSGLTYVHLLPVFDIASIPERRADQQQPPCDLASYAPDSDEQQACVDRVAGQDAYNWGYDPLHYTVPEGSYAGDPDGTARIREFHQMVGGLNAAGLRVVMDVVYNHTPAAGQDGKSVLDRIVPGYYQRLQDDGTVANSTCCANTAPENAMMGKLVVDSVVTWAKEYKVDGFRFDLMGHHPKSNLLAVRKALDGLTLAEDGVDGKRILLYGEGWNFGEVANDARFVQATQANLAGTGIGTFNDRLRDAVRGGGPFDGNPRVQGFGSGLFTDPNGDDVNGSAEQQRARLLHLQDLVKVGLAGNLAEFSFTDSSGRTVKGREVDYNGSPAGYTADPQEAITYVDAHDNETLYDALVYKLPQSTSMPDRVRMQALSLATVELGQGPAFLQAGSDVLRSKSLDRNSYNSGDWFNRLHVDCRLGNGFGSGLPLAADNQDTWPYMRPLLGDPGLRAGCPAMTDAGDRFEELLEIRGSSPLFRLGSQASVQRHLSFPLSGSDETPGVVTMLLDDRVGADVDPRWESVTVVLNGSDETQAQVVPRLAGRRVSLHPVQAHGGDAVVKQSSYDRATGTLTVPPRTVAVFVER